MRSRLPVMLLALAAVAAAAAPASKPAAPPQPVEVYESPRDYAAGGDFTFRYPPSLVVLQDFVYADAAVAGARHTVVLRLKSAETGDLRSIEINNLRSLRQRLTCADYSACRVVDGVVIGTDSEDPEFLKVFDLITSSFKRR